MKCGGALVLTLGLTTEYITHFSLCPFVLVTIIVITTMLKAITNVTALVSAARKIEIIVPVAEELLCLSCMLWFNVC